MRYLLLTGACLLAFVANADDWPEWMGPFAQNRSAETGLPVSFDRNDLTNVKWATKLGGVVFGCPSVSEGKIFVGTNALALRDDPRFRGSTGGVLVCLDEATGEVLWRLVTPERFDGFPKYTHMINQRWGICSSPTVDGERIYLVTNGDDLLCVDVHGMANGNDGPFMDEHRFMARAGSPSIEIGETDGDIVWRYDIPRELSVAPHDIASCTVLIDGDVLYLSTSNGLGKKNPAEALMPDAPAFIAVDKRTGRLLAVEDEGLSARIFHAQWSSPSKGCIDGRGLIFLGGGDGFCYAFEAISANSMVDAKDPLRLKTVWTYDCNPHHYQFDEEGDRIWFYQGDLRVYKSRKRSDLSTAGLNSGDGSFVGPSQVLATPVLYQGCLYVATGRDPMHGLGKGALHCIDASLTGDISESGRVWVYEDIGRTLSSVAIEDGLVYAADLGGRLHCLDAATGDLYWMHDTREESWGNPLVADGKVYFNTTRAFWVLAAGRQKQVLSRQRGGSEMGAIAANGVVYAFIRGRLYALAEGVAARQDLVTAERANTSDNYEALDDPSVLEMPDLSTITPDPPSRRLAICVAALLMPLATVLLVWRVRRSGGRPGNQ